MRLTVDSAGAASGYEHGAFRIYEYFQEGHGTKETVAFLKKEYGTGGQSHALPGADHSYEDHDAKGIRFRKGCIVTPYIDVLLSWKVVEKRIRKLIAQDRYLSPEGKEKYARYQEEQAQKRLEEEKERLENQTKIACKEAVEKAIADHFDGYHLSDHPEDGVIQEFGAERVSYVLAYTVSCLSHDRRFSEENREWAKGIEPNGYGHADLFISSHPAVLDGFISDVRKYIEREKELATEKITAEIEDAEKNDISEAELDWHIIYEADDDNGQPTQWSVKLPNGEFLWIDIETEGYALYDTHNTDASPVSVSETLDEAKKSGEDYALELSELEKSSEITSITKQETVEIEIIPKTTVAIETSDDYSEPEFGFYTHQYADGRDGTRYRLVKMDDDGYLVPYLPDHQFFMNQELVQEYIDIHEDVLDVISYDDMVYDSIRTQKEYQNEKTQEKADISGFAEENGTEEYRTEAEGADALLKPEQDVSGHHVQTQERKPESQSEQIDKINAVNFRISDDALSADAEKANAGFSPKEKFRRNIEAIRTLEKIEGENRIATPEEQAILSQYVGWGGLADAFDENKSAWAGEYQQLKELLSPEEYRLARESTLNAHYTSPIIIRSIYETLDRMGFSKGNILEPSMGIGNFFGMLPETMRGSRLYGVELDDITGRIAKLYPNADIRITGFEKTNYPGDFFDVAVGNVPFGQYKVTDRQYDKHNFLVHDYFFAKTLDKVRPGGIVAFVKKQGNNG